MKKRLSIIICMIISISMFVSACGIFGAKKYPDPQETIDALLTALSEGDIEAASELVADKIDFDMSGYDEMTQEFVSNYFNQMTIEVDGEPEYKGKKADLSITVTAPDLNASLAAAVDGEDNEYIVLMVKDILLASLNGEDTTVLQEDMLNSFLEETKKQMADPGNQTSTDSTMKMILNEDGDGWIIDEMSDDFIDPAAVDVDSDEVAAAVEKSITDVIPAALDMLLEEGSIDQATYDAMLASI